jgi:hypothetical protein
MSYCLRIALLASRAGAIRLSIRNFMELPVGVSRQSTKRIGPSWSSAR